MDTIFFHIHNVPPHVRVCERQKKLIFCVWGPRRHMSQLCVGVQVIYAT